LDNVDFRLAAGRRIGAIHEHGTVDNEFLVRAVDRNAEVVDLAPSAYRPCQEKRAPGVFDNDGSLAEADAGTAGFLHCIKSLPV
jgi:hypothetical protein